MVEGSPIHWLDLFEVTELASAALCVILFIIACLAESFSSLITVKNLFVNKQKNLRSVIVRRLFEKAI